MGIASTSPATFHHEALFYAGDDEFAERCGSFVEEGLEQGEPVLVMVGSRKLELLRAALGERAERVSFADMEIVGRNPARIIPEWSRFVADNASEGGGGMRGIGEPIWAGRKPDEMSECQLHESLINVAFASADWFRLICPYDTGALPGDVVEEARRSHPHVSAEGDPEPCGDYRGIDRAAAGFREPLPEPPQGSDELIVTVDQLREARDLVRRRGLAAGLAGRADDLVLAVNEILSNSISHARENGALRIWREPGAVVCEVTDGGHIPKPLVGREEPAAGQIGGQGIWLVNLVCDLVQVRSSAAGSTVRMKMSLA